MIEPLVVYPDGEDYVILEGVQRYRILLELGVEVVPCILGKHREAFYRQSHGQTGYHLYRKTG